MGFIHSSTLLDIGSGKWTIYTVQYSRVELLNYALLSDMNCTS